MDDFCRCCAVRSKNLCDIYTKDYGQQVNSADKLKIFNKLEVEGQSMLSKKICNNCLLQLGIAFDFFQKFIKAQETLKTIFTQMQQKKIPLLLPKEEGLNYTCMKCSSVYSDKSVFEAHLKQHSIKRRLYRCYFCTETFASLKEFRDHINSHSVRDVCKFCHSFFNNKVSLDRHIDERHKNSKYVCLNCSQDSHTRRSHILHMEKYHHEILFFCGECKQGEFKGIEKLNNHAMELHPKYKENLHAEEDIFMDEEFLDEFFLNQDDNFHFNEYLDSLSLSFDVDFKDKINIEKEYCPDSEARYRCPHCTKVFDKQITLKVHLAHEHNIETLICTNCDSSFSRLEDLKKHRILHKSRPITHESTDFKCELCQQQFSSHIILDSHRKEAHPNNKLHCPICNKNFQTLRGYLYHEKIHSGLKNYNCPYCKHKFAVDVGLSAHIRTVHSEIKMNICKLCDSRFATTDHLRKHVTSFHQKERNYLCSTCGKGFAQSSHLKQHTQIHTGNRPFQCSSCDRGFFKRSDLLKHTKKAHSDAANQSIDAEKNLYMLN